MIYQPISLDNLYAKAVEHSLNDLFESRLDSPRTSYERQCEFRRKSIRRQLKARLGKFYNEADYDSWNKKQYRCGW